MRRHLLPRSLPAGALLAGAVLAGLPAPAESQASRGPETVEAFAEAFVTAVRGWDVDAWAELVTENVVMMAPSGRMVEGRSAFRELWERSFQGQTGRNPLQVRVRDVRRGEDMAVVRADYGPEGADPVGQYVWLLERDDRAGWLLAWWIFNRRPAEGGP